jgi:hypothetical protein
MEKEIQKQFPHISKIDFEKICDIAFRLGTKTSLAYDEILYKLCRLV